GFPPFQKDGTNNVISSVAACATCDPDHPAGLGEPLIGIVTHDDWTSGVAMAYRRIIEIEFAQLIATVIGVVTAFQPNRTNSFGEGGRILSLETRIWRIGSAKTENKEAFYRVEAGDIITVTRIGLFAGVDDTEWFDRKVLRER